MCVGMKKNCENCAHAEEFASCWQSLFPYKY